MPASDSFRRPIISFFSPPNLRYFGFFAVFTAALFLFPAHVAAYDIQTIFASKSATLAVDARVKARPDNFQLQLSSDHPTNIVGAGEDIEYTITYGSTLSYWTPMVIEADWSLGTVANENLYSYDIVNYVAGSATNDWWGESTPVVDISHRKIIWRIKNFRPDTLDKPLRFKLRTAGRYVTDKSVQFTITAKLSTDEVGLDPVSLEQSYDPTSFIQREIKGTQILGADVKQVTDTSFSLYLVTNIPTKTVIYYGTDPLKLDKTFIDDTFAEEKLLTITGLTPATTYYYKILIENDKGVQKKTPEIFTVMTSSDNLIALIDSERLMVTSRGVLLKNTPGLGASTTIVVPTNVSVELFVPFRSNSPQTVSMSLQNRKVLGISTDEPLSTADQKIRLLETMPRTFTGSVTTPKTPGVYDVILETDSGAGGINRDVMATFVVSRPITVTDQQGKPVEAALVYLDRYNTAKRAYEYFPAQSFGSRNPAKTNELGATDFILPEGGYRINVNAIGYLTYQKYFTFTPTGGIPYPQITLVPAPFSLTTYVKYYGAILADSLRYFNYSVDQLSISGRFIDASLFASVVILTVLSIFANAKRMKLSAEGLYISLEKRIRRIVGKEKTDNLYIGFVENEAGVPIHGAVVAVSLQKTHVVVGHDITNGMGEFHIRMYPGLAYDLTAKKPGYENLKTELPVSAFFEEQPPVSMIPLPKNRLPAAIEFLTVVFASFARGMSDLLLFAVGVLNLLLFFRLGAEMLPTIILTGINAALWTEYQWEMWKQSRRGK